MIGISLIALGNELATNFALEEIRMRALCGAIITAGALIGLGLTAVGVGYRYQLYPYQSPEGKPQWVSFNHVDSTLMIVLAALLISLVIGMAIAFLGLAYHHHRRHHEMLREQTGARNGHHVTA
jgi:hypothetical protein